MQHRRRACCRRRARRPVDDYVRAAASQGSRIAAVIETHVQADHVSGLPELVERTGATAYLPEGAEDAAALT